MSVRHQQTGRPMRRPKSLLLSLADRGLRNMPCRLDQTCRSDPQPSSYRWKVSIASTCGRRPRTRTPRWRLRSAWSKRASARALSDRRLPTARSAPGPGSRCSPECLGRRRSAHSPHVRQSPTRRTRKDRPLPTSKAPPSSRGEVEHVGCESQPLLKADVRADDHTTRPRDVQVVLLEAQSIARVLGSQERSETFRYRLIHAERELRYRWILHPIRPSGPPVRLATKVEAI